MSVTITLRREDIGPWLLRFRNDLDPGRLAKVAGRRWHTLLMRHFRNDVANRHTTANRLGATPTGHWQNPSRYVKLSASGKATEIEVTKPGIARAVRDVTIRPRVAQALALPLSALSYGKRPAEAERDLGRRIFRPKGTRVLVAERNDGKAWDVLYALSSAVFQKKDPTLLPPEQTTLEAVERAMMTEAEAIALEALRR